jgi:hypothetical protein
MMRAVRSGSIRRVAGCLFAAFGAVAALAGCSAKKTLAPNLPPETTLFVQGPVDTVSYHAHLYWFGTDSDGFVTAYEFRFLDPATPADSAWIRTTRSDSLFSVPAPTGVSQPVFQVRAIDNEGAIDESPARQSFFFRNLPPTIAIVGGPAVSDPTFAAATFTWYATDPVGDIADATYQVWLDGNEDNPVVTTSSSFTVPTAQFLQGGQLRSGPRTVFVRAIDAGGYATAPVSRTWYVRAPVTGADARLLIIDDENGNDGLALSDDTLYVNTATRNLPPGTFSILRLEFTQPFHSTSDLEQTLKLFDAVIWYRGTDGLQPILTDYRDAIGAYLESGGKFYLESSKMVVGQNADGIVEGIFPEDWVSRYFGSTGLLRHRTDTSPFDSSVVWSVRRNTNLFSSVFSDSLRAQRQVGEMRGFAVRDTQYVATWARAGVLTEGNEFDVPIAVTVPQAGGGRLVAVTYSPARCNGFGTAARFLAKVFQQMGLTN